MSKKTAVGGFDGEDWVPIAGLLISAGVLPKSLRPYVGALGTVLLLVKIGKQLGWL
jgi:hypothetical protein